MAWLALALMAQHLTAYGDGDFWHSIRVADSADTWEWALGSVIEATPRETAVPRPETDLS